MDRIGSDVDPTATRRRGMIAAVAVVLLGPVTVIGMIASGAGSAPAPGGAAVCARNDGERLLRLISGTQTCAAHETKVQLSGAPTAGGGGITGVERISRASRASGNTYQSATATCPNGKTALGGGYDLVNYAGGELPAVLQYTRPTPSLDSWEVAANLNGRFFGNWAITAYVVCAKPA